MSNFTVIFTDVPIRFPDNNDGKSSPERFKTIGGSTISEGFDDDRKGRILPMFPGMYPNFSWHPLNKDLMNMARDYLRYGKEIIFFETQYGTAFAYNYRDREEIGEYLIDISKVPVNSMPKFNGEKLESDTFNIYRVISGEGAQCTCIRQRVDWDKVEILDFTAIFTDTPLEKLDLRSMKDFDFEGREVWLLEGTIIEKRYKWSNGDIVKEMFPKLKMYVAWGLVDEDLFDLAGEYLDHGDIILFTELQSLSADTVNTDMIGNTKEIVIDISNRQPRTSPFAEIKDVPDILNIYRIVKTRT